MTNINTASDAVKTAGLLKDSIAASIFGQEELVTEALCCLFAGGHILITGAPGLAKTTLVRVLAKHLGLEYNRVQFTPDLLPSDIVGSEILNVDGASGKRSFEFVKGPVFTNLLLADEINRASPRTQSALLEAMQERSCTVAGKTHALGDPFMVFATQNPFESEGTFPLPEAQLDRFLLHTLVPYPQKDVEEKILQEHAQNRLAGEVRSSAPPKSSFTLDKYALLKIIELCKTVTVEPEIIQLINELVRSSRPDDESCPEELRGAFWYGAGPRAGISLVSTARVLALMSGSETVRWQHVRRLAKPVLRHRLRLTSGARRSEEVNEDFLVTKLLENLEDKHKNLTL